MKKKAKVAKRRQSKKSSSAYLRISKHEYEFLMKELAYYRGKYDEERQRADALVNTLLQGNGLPAPQIETSLATHPKDPRRLAVERRITELFEDEIVDTLDVAPEVAEAS